MDPYPNKRKRIKRRGGGCNHLGATVHSARGVNTTAKGTKSASGKGTLRLRGTNPGAIRKDQASHLWVADAERKKKKTGRKKREGGGKNRAGG